MAFKGIRDGIKDRLDAAKTIDKIEELCKHIEDIAEAQDEMVKAVCSIYANQVAIAKKIGAKLPEPLTDMTIEDEIISRNPLFDKAIKGDK